MEIAQAEPTSWYEACSRCKKPTFVDLLDEEGLCDYCREIVAMRQSTGRKHGGRKGERTLR